MCQKVELMMYRDKHKGKPEPVPTADPENIVVESKLCRDVKAVMGTLGILAGAGILAILLGWFFYYLDSPRTIRLFDGLYIQFSNDRFFEFSYINRSLPVLTGFLATTFKLTQDLIYYDIVERNESFIRVAFNNQASFEMSWSQHNRINAYEMWWTARSCQHAALQDCFRLRNAHWYGTGDSTGFSWPLQVSLAEQPFSGGISPTGASETYWLSSQNAAVKVPWNQQIWVSINSTSDGELCLKSKYRASSGHFRGGGGGGGSGRAGDGADERYLRLHYSVFTAPDMISLQSYIYSYVNEAPIDTPSFRMFLEPAWTLQQDVDNNKSIRAYAQEILDHDYEGFMYFISPYEVNQTLKEGSTLREEYDFAKDVSAAEKLGFCPNVALLPYAVMSGGKTRFTAWAFGEFLDSIDIQLEARRWLHAAAKRLKGQSVCASFVSTYLPTSNKFGSSFNEYIDHHKYTILKVLTNVSLDTFPHTVLSEPGHLQRVPAFLKMKDRYFTWNTTHGLAGIIPEALTLSLAGYSFIMAPGLRMEPGTVLSEALTELYIRWIQLTALFPAQHFITPPWKFPENVTKIAQKFASLHREMANRMIHSGEEAVKTGVPILRPIWWVDPRDGVAQTVGDQFMVGDVILVAPVTRPNSTERDIYLPNGTWWDNLRLQKITGGVWLSQYQVAFDELPHFEKTP